MVPLSVLDLSPIVEGGDAGQSLRNSLDLARHVERLGYRRYWMAEHHNLPGIASAATAVALAYVAGGTSTIPIGAGGIMLPNHAPLLIAEQFGTLAALLSRPGRARARARARLRPDDDAGDPPDAAHDRRRVPAGRRRIDALFRHARARPGGDRGAGRRAQGADLDPGVEPVRRAACRVSRACPSPSPRISHRGC